MLALSEASQVALISLVGIFITAVFAYLGQREARGANRAVNKVGPDETPLKDRVETIETKTAAIEGKVDLLVNWLKPDDHKP